MRKIKIVEDGNFSDWVRLLFIVVGFALMFFAFKLIPPTLTGGVVALIGFGLALVGGFFSRAHMLKIKPFGNSVWRKAKQTYKEDGRS
ncbi:MULTISPECIES: hypothetical protein [unclassified Burkholderia]|uniref:hypothetical protein n=1 Tax=unclassified Burkholderia TaxID=2613784 RepID=UPI002AB27837|nr:MULTISPECIES: hypothetical protein [unclassified Burkholderia]